MKISKEISEKMREANRLNNEIIDWMKENIDCDGITSFDEKFWNIVPEPHGEAQDDNGEEYYNQSNPYEDCYFGEYYYKLEKESNYIELSFSL